MFLKGIFLKIVWIFGSYIAYSQAVFSTDYKSQAEVKVYVVDYASQADLKVFKVDYPSLARGNKGLWYFVEYKSQSDKTIFFVEYPSQADLLIYFVDYKSQAGWKNNSLIHLMY